MNSDIASDAILSTLIWNSKQIIPDTWYIANEVRIMILLSVSYFLRCLHIDGIYRLLMEFLCLAIPTGFVLLELLYLFAIYYAIHAVIMFFALGVYLELTKNKKHKACSDKHMCYSGFHIGNTGNQRDSDPLWSAVWHAYIKFSRNLFSSFSGTGY